MSNVKVKFIRDYKVKDEEGKEYAEGKTYPMNEASAQHFVRRGAAVLIDGATPAPEAPHTLTKAEEKKALAADKKAEKKALADAKKAAKDGNPPPPPPAS